MMLSCKKTEIKKTMSFNYGEFYVAVFIYVTVSS